MVAGIVFFENGAVDAAQLNALYRTIAWDRENRRRVEGIVTT